MSLSTVVEWLNENALRAYPLISSSPRFFQCGSNVVDLYGVIVDANFVYKTQLPSNVQLTSIIIAGSNVTFTVNELPTFTISLSSPTFPIYARNSNNDLLVIGDQAVNLVGDATYAFNDVIFEPTIAVEIANELSGVSSLQLGDKAWTGVINLLEGYQVDITVVDNSLQITVGRNEGQVLPCQNFFSDSLTYDCGQVISYINGASPADSGGILTLKAGDHIKIFEDKEQGRIYIGFDFNVTDICPSPLLGP